jgi:hypothetical protein
MCVRKGQEIPLAGCGQSISAQQNFNVLHVWNKKGTPPQDAQKFQTSHPPNPGAPRRAFSQARPQAPRLTLVSRLTFHGSWERSENDAGGLFQDPARLSALIRDSQSKGKSRNLRTALGESSVSMVFCRSRVGQSEHQSSRPTRPIRRTRPTPWPHRTF